MVRGLGFESFTFDPLYNADIVIYGILIAGLWQGTGLIMCLMLAGLRGIDEDIWKAARVDGIPMWKTYLFIVIPMMRPVFITTLVIIASGIVKLYDLVVAQTGGGPGIASEVPAKVRLRLHVPGAEPRPGLRRLDDDAAHGGHHPRPLGLPRVRRKAPCLTPHPRRRRRRRHRHRDPRHRRRAAPARAGPSRAPTSSSTAR